MSRIEKNHIHLLVIRVTIFCLLEIRVTIFAITNILQYCNRYCNTVKHRDINANCRRINANLVAIMSIVVALMSIIVTDCDSNAPVIALLQLEIAVNQTMGSGSCFNGVLLQRSYHRVRPNTPSLPQASRNSTSNVV